MAAQRAKLPAPKPLPAPTPGKKEKVPLQGMSALQKQAAPPNRTGLPNPLKAGIESLSDLSMDAVKVHYSSAKPARMQAHAYAQGTDIHVAPGQEKHLPHEAWHVVQQAQGRVKPTLQAKGVAINDDKGLEAEADRMGTQALLAPDKLPIGWDKPPFILEQGKWRLAYGNQQLALMAAG